MPRLREQGDLDDAGMTAMEREIMSALEAVAEEMRRGAPANSDALQSRLAALQRRPRTLAYAMRLIDHLAFAIRREGKYPSRPEFYRRLKTIEVLASRGRLPLARERLMQELADPQLFALLTNGDPRIERALLPTKKAIRRPSEPMRSIHLFNGNLRNVGRLAVAAQKRHPPRRGQGKLHPDPAVGPDAREYCALIVSIAWHKEAGKWPGYGNPTAQLICEAMWRAGGGAPHQPHGGFDAPDTFATWGKHLVAARRYQQPHAAAAQVADSLARSLARLSEKRPRPPIESDPIRAPRRSILVLLKSQYDPFFSLKTST